MNKRAISIVSALALSSVLPFVAAPAPAAPAQSPRAVEHDASGKQHSDNRLHPLAVRRANLRQAAVDELTTDDARLVGKGRNRSIEMADGTKVDYPVTQEAQLLSFLVEFGAEGPLAGGLPAKETTDNSTYWKPDFDRQHYLDMFFNGMPEQGGESFRQFYREMSSGRFNVDGDVSDWVQIDRPGSYYGANVADDREDPERLAEYIQDTANAWYDAQGGDAAGIKDYLAQFDVWDRYDADGDGDVNEPDGYIDHFQAIHAGAGEEAGADPSTIWSHRSGASYWTNTGPEHTSECSACVPQGGVEIGDSGYFILDYTTEPENGGLGVFAHEFGHDLGLPDYYDTTGADNGTGFWSLMSAGSWLGHGDGTLGTTPGHMGATEKYFLGWYGAADEAGHFDDLQKVDGLAAEPTTVALGPSYRANTRGAQAVLVELPNGSRTLDGPFGGSDDGRYLYSGTRDAAIVGADSPAVTVPEGDATLTARVAYQIEPDFDFAFLRASTDGGETWTDLQTSESNGKQPGFEAGITGVSSEAEPEEGETWRDLPVSWRSLSADLSAYAGQSLRVRWEYYTDGNTHGSGFAVDDVEIGSYATSYAATDDWVLDRFHAVAGDEYTVDYPQSYLAENRQYRGYDQTLETGPYSWGHQITDPNRADQFPYQDGLLVWYSNGFHGDNDSGLHPGEGANLPVDAGAQNQIWRDGSGAPVQLTDGRLQAYDATFDVDQTDPLALSAEATSPGGVETVTLDVPSVPSVPVFDDVDPDAYLDDSGSGLGDPAGDGHWFSTKVAGSGAMIQVVSSNEATGQMTLKIGKRFVAATSAPGLTGANNVGDTLTATPPAWFQGDVTTTLSWLRDGVTIPGASSSDYRIAAADTGRTISAAFTGAKDGYVSTTHETAGVKAVAVPAPTTPLGITGTAVVGQTLTARGATWPLTGASTYVWSIGGATIGTGSTYVVKPADLGRTITLTESFASPGHTTATATAVSSAVTAGAAPAATTGPKIAGRAKVGSKLSVTGATWPLAGASTYAWTIAGKSVGSGTSYTLRPADVGKRVTVTETFTSPGYDAATARAQSGAVEKASVALKVTKGKAKRGKPVALAIRATAGSLKVPGKVRISYAGKRLRQVTLREGRATVRLPGKGKGRYRLTVTYLGATGFATTSRTITVRVR